MVSCPVGQVAPLAGEAIACNVEVMFIGSSRQRECSCEVRHQENLSNVLFYIQDADQRLKNELSGMVQFVPKDMEEERVRHHSEDPVDRRGGGGQCGRCKGLVSRAARRPDVYVTQRGLSSSVQVEVDESKAHTAELRSATAHRIP